MSFGTEIKSECYKCFHSPVWIIHLVIPVVGCAIFLWYDSFSVMKEFDKIALYIETLSVIYPILIGLITAMASEFEQNAAGCQLLLTVSTPKYKAHISKLVMLMIFGLGSAVIAVAGFGLGFRMLGYTSLPLGCYLELSVLLFLSVVPLYEIHYLVSFLCGKGYSIGIGIAGGLLSALLLTGLGDFIWWMLPWGIAARFSMNFLQSKSVHLSFMQYNGNVKGILFLTGFALVLSVIFIFVFRRWEGRKSDGE